MNNCFSLSIQPFSTTFLPLSNATIISSTTDKYTRLTQVLCTQKKDCKLIDGSFCNNQTGTCICKAQFPIFDADQCLRKSQYGEYCHTPIQCSSLDEHSTCDNTLHVCKCAPMYKVKNSMTPGKFVCSESLDSLNMTAGSHFDPALFAILAALALMFIIICVVLQLFAKARFQENRSIFNTPNPRLMNVSFMKERHSMNSSFTDSHSFKTMCNDEKRLFNAQSLTFLEEESLPRIEESNT